MKVKEERRQFYKSLNTDGEATGSLLKIIPQLNLIAGFDTYCALNHLLSSLPVIPFPIHITEPVDKGLNILSGKGYLTKEEAQEIKVSIEKKVKKNIKQYQSPRNKKARLERFITKKRRDFLYRYSYPETLISEHDKAPLDFLIYFLAVYCDKRFKLHEDGYDKWGLIEDFLDEQGIKIDGNTAKKRYQRNKRYIPIVYNFIYNNYPHGCNHFRKLLEWKGKTTPEKKALVEFKYCQTCKAAARMKGKNLNCNSCNREIEFVEFLFKV